MSINQKEADNNKEAEDFLSDPKQNLELAQFFRTVHKGIRIHGIKKIIKVIKSIDLQENNLFFSDILDFIFKSVAEEYNVSVSAIKGKDTRGDVTVARKMAIILIKENVDVSDEFLAYELDRVRQVVHHVLKEYKGYTRKLRYNKNENDVKDFFAKYDKLTLKIDDYIESLK